MENKQNQQEIVDRMFKEGLTVVILNWPVMKLIIQNGWASKNDGIIRDDPEAKQMNVQDEFCKTESQAVKDFIEDAFKYVISYDCKQEDLEDWLLKEIEERFYTLIEDHSQIEIAAAALQLFSQLENGNYTLYEEIKKMGATMKNIRVSGQCGNRDEDDSDEEGGDDWEESSVIGPDDKIENELTEEELKQIEEEKAEKEKKQQVMEEDGFSVVVTKKKK